MKKRPPRYGSKMWEWLYESGIDLSNEEALSQAKKAYRKQYKRNHARQHRSENPEVTVRFSQDEYQSLRVFAGQYQKPLATTIKACYQAFRQGSSHLPKPKQYGHIEQMLRITQSDLRMLSKHIQRMGQQELAEVITALAKRYESLEKQINSPLKVPQKPRD